MKKEITKTLLMVLFFFLVLLVSLSSRAGKQYRPRPMCDVPQTIYTDMLAEPFRDRHIKDAVAFWNQRLGFAALTYGGRAPLTYKVSDNLGFIGVRAAEKDEVETWATKYGKSCRGIADSTFDHDTGCRHGTGIWLDERCIVAAPASNKDRENGCVSEVFLYKLTLHEIGHALGFTHSEHVNTIMYKSISETYTRLELGKDTLIEMIALYPETTLRWSAGLED